MSDYDVASVSASVTACCRVRRSMQCFGFQEAECDGCSSENEDGRNVGELLLPQYVLATGGLARDHRPLISFPDNNNFHVLTPAEYRRLLLYLTSIPSLLEADMGFHIIIDRRKDRWNSVKAVLLRISKALSEVSSKLFKEEFRFRVLVCSSVDELYEHFDRSQLTPDLGGELQYNALKAELLSATSQGEELLTQVRKPNLTYNIINYSFNSMRLKNSLTVSGINTP
ncbi:unnamed protein product [Leptidea sinapis]|uniref:CRAL-TRIO domain-containing protein n=1 Tax=Leptidea sinapis TaxID=189913 RepID=A0A5E4QW35_9NEOP|nr:unnamed protein product [Leptidea sinapis]